MAQVGFDGWEEGQLGGTVVGIIYSILLSSLDIVIVIAIAIIVTVAVFSSLLLIPYNSNL